MKEVSLRSCNSYDYEEVKLQIDKLVNDLGGLDKYIKYGSTVFIKLNLVIKKKPEEVATTHPIVLKAIANKLLELGCKVIVGDSPGGPYTKSSLKGIYKTCGIEEVCNELNIQLNYDTSELKVENPNGIVLKYMTVIKPIVDVDYVINLCKLKTHAMATFTGGVKNLFGVIPGVLKAEYHFKMPEVRDFTDALIDICLFVSPTITIMDGIIGMEGEGPTSGTPRKIGVLLASSNPYAIDVIACKLINLEPGRVPTVQRCIERKFINEDFSDIHVIGEEIENKIIKDFKIPSNRSISFLRGIVPKKIELFVNKKLSGKPVINFKDCIKCGECSRVCPPKVISMKENGPVIDLDHCIRCFCCHELCPRKAVDLKRPFIFKFLR
ncbi:DUF362 domain-containing protein [Romboutsia sp. 1001713B170207_170306_H8]|uniref:DUF362 domain-containing protein n=1 Tax=Romboutsia sp. 1001713B170207_170306_H8 TaxID=2787112 RepID=UPI000822248C|nr:DUF362 domain-containing protein [Romboutsia sp. 1001713B170207_170306_H8]SCI13876.1 formate hydrogenlyase complex iron-sulfur subunit [uncultured Clostridium sp.]